MRKSSQEGGMMSEYGSWNVASTYAHLKIMKPLYLADEYETVATFGSVDFVDQLNINYPIDLLKIKGFERLVRILITIIDNSIFAIRHSRDKETLKTKKEELNKIFKIIPSLYEIKRNQRNKTQTLILKSMYDIVLENVRSIKAEINTPLNKSHLIFVDKDEWDPKKQKKQLLDDLKKTG